MDALTENALATMPGPEFLLFYGFFALGAALVFLLVATLDDDEGRPPPAPARPDPYELAYLRDGPGGVVWLAIYALKRAGLVELGENGALTPLGGAAPANRFEAAALRAIGSGCKARNLVGDATLAALARALDDALAAKGLTCSAATRGRIWRWAMALAAALVALALYKIAVATAHGHRNVGFLMVEAVVAVGALAVAAARLTARKANARGRAWLERIRLAQEDGRPTAGFGAGSAAMLLVGLYGFEILADGPDAAFAQAARKARGDGGGDGGGSCSGGDGGGGGGGGCGGCGGGGD